MRRRRRTGILSGVTRPPLRRRLAVVLVDLAVLAVVGPVIATGLGFVLSWAFYLPVRRDCPSPCDGPAMLGFSLAMLLLFSGWVLYWPLLALWRRRTIGSRLAGLRFEGRGLRRHLVWDSAGRS